MNWKAENRISCFLVIFAIFNNHQHWRIIRTKIKSFISEESIVLSYKSYRDSLDFSSLLALHKKMISAEQYWFWGYSSLDLYSSAYSENLHGKMLTV